MLLTFQDFRFEGPVFLFQIILDNAARTPYHF